MKMTKTHGKCIFLTNINAEKKWSLAIYLEEYMWRFQIHIVSSAITILVRLVLEISSLQKSFFDVNISNDLFVLVH